MLTQIEWQNNVIENFWQEAEEQTERLLRHHAAEVEAVSEALLEKGDLTGKECAAIIAKTAAGFSVPRESLPLIQQVEENALHPEVIDQVPVDAEEPLTGPD
jgi:hypothetical protein